ncbi:SMI1 / KNR4 family (SUKH-1) [Catalinimonas alkaloidigena]|uniref:SMI1 / KNR4 family (SUKH-1) n=2 Tax=Catalinimonas alkaloidigena TaxID=1075417 RepID=A0A1G9QPQ6_9BACT|nr:SMI1 / KNR4 family (SUKH-1) [Catalinimonas alkaloidigena]
MLRLKNPGVVPCLHPGLSDETIQRKTAALPFELPNELKALYQWHNGSSDLREVLEIDEEMAPDFFYAGQLFHSIELSLRYYKSKSHYGQQNYEHSLWTPFLFPITDDGAGWQLVVDCEPDSADTGKIYFFNGIEWGKVQTDEYPFESALMYRNLAAMLKTVLACFEENAYFFAYDENGEFGMQWDDEKETQIGRRMNPDCAYW